MKNYDEEDEVEVEETVPMKKEMKKEMKTGFRPSANSLNLKKEIDFIGIINHYKKLMVCEQFIITGSFGWMQLGLMSKAKDLDIILVNPTEESLAVLEKLREPSKNTDYPNDKNQFLVNHEGTMIYFFINTSKIDTIELANGISIASIKGTVKAKKRFARLKDFLQLKNIAEIFYNEAEFTQFLRNQQDKVK